MSRNGSHLSDGALDALERITAELRVLERRCRKLKFDEIGYMLGLAEESAKQTLLTHASVRADETNFIDEENEDDRSCVIPFRVGA